MLLSTQNNLSNLLSFFNVTAEVGHAIKQQMIYFNQHYHKDISMSSMVQRVDYNVYGPFLTI